MRGCAREWVCKSPCGRGREHSGMCKGCVAEHVATGRAPLVALGMGTCKEGSCAAQSSSSPNAPLQRAGPQIRAGLRGAGISQPLGALRGRERGRGRGWGLREGGGGGWYWCSCGPTWGQAGDKGEGMASTRGACCSGETEARSCFPQGRPQGSAAQLKQIGGGEA